MKKLSLAFPFYSHTINNTRNKYLVFIGFLLITVASVLIYALKNHLVFVSAGLYDGGIYQYVIFNNIQNWHHYSLHYGIPQKMFNGDPYAALYTDPLYTHSLLYLPFYLLTKNEYFLVPYFRLLQIILGTVGLSSLFFFIFFHLQNKKWQLWPLYLLPINIAINIWLLLIPPLLRGHLQLLPTFPWIWTILFLMLFFYYRRTTHFLGLAIVSLTLFATMSAYYLVFLVYLSIVIILLLLIYGIFHFRNLHLLSILGKSKEILSQLRLRTLLIYTFVSFSWLMLSYFPYLTMTKLKIFRPLSEDNFYSLDLVLSFLVPKYGSYVWKILFKQIIPKLAHVGDTTITLGNDLFLGGTILLVAILSISAFWIIIKSRNRITKGLYIGSLIMLFSMFVFALGPQLKIAGKLHNIKLPLYYLYHLLPLFKGIRVPARIMILIQPFLLILWVTSVAAIIEFLKRQKAQVFLLLGVAIMLVPLSFIDTYRGPFPYTDTANIFWKKHEGLYALIRDLPGDSLLELPTVPYFRTQGAFLPGILIHHKTLVNGRSGLSPKKNNILQSKILHAAHPDNPAELLDLLCQENIDIVVYHYDYVSLTRENLQRVIPDQMFWLDLNENVAETLKHFPPETQVYQDSAHYVVDLVEYCSKRK